MNRPQTLNALNLEAYQLMIPKLQQWQNRKDIACVVFHSNIEKSFSAGGDVKVLAQELIEKNNINFSKEFFCNEYFTDLLIHKFNKPILMWGNGLVMGGGFGLMNGASHRAVTENTSLSMPEISIGLFPDVGATYYFSQVKKDFGVYLSMTGARFSGSEAIRMGLADHYLCAKKFRHIMADILRASWSDSEDENKKILDDLLNPHSLPPSESSTYLSCEDVWQRIWNSSPDYESFKENFLSQSDKFPDEDIKRFKEGAPVSRKIIWEIFKNRRPKNIEEALTQEWILAANSCKAPFLKEGVRALLIDKDNSPQWGSDKDIPWADVLSFFNLPSGESNDFVKKIKESFK